MHYKHRRRPAEAPMRSLEPFPPTEGDRAATRHQGNPHCRNKTGDHRHLALRQESTTFPRCSITTVPTTSPVHQSYIALGQNPTLHHPNHRAHHHPGPRTIFLTSSTMGVRSISLRVFSAFFASTTWGPPTHAPADSPWQQGSSVAVCLRGLL